MLIRPDGYVAWASKHDQPQSADGLREALEFWFGPASREVATADLDA